MEVLIKIVQVVIALGILNVWLFRFGKPTAWRAGEARNMKEEFAVYGFPPWFMTLIGCFKILFAALLILGLWMPHLTGPAASGLAVLMLGAVAMHVKVKDPFRKSMPALALLFLCILVAAASW